MSLCNEWARKAGCLRLHARGRCRSSGGTRWVASVCPSSHSQGFYPAGQTGQRILFHRLATLSSAPTLVVASVPPTLQPVEQDHTPHHICGLSLPCQTRLSPWCLSEQSWRPDPWVRAKLCSERWSVQILLSEAPGGTEAGPSSLVG